ncbi:MAG: DUF5946 family protein [Thermoanaerobaculia bacterium]
MHRYIGASPGCWRTYGEVLAREYGEFAMPAEHRLTVDAYAVQHPGTPSPQAIRSVAVHLMALHLALEEGVELARVTGLLSRFAKRDGYEWLVPPADGLGEITVVDVHAARDLAEHRELVWRWARSVWAAWSPHHGQVRAWASG